jgi:uncharacterized protein (DUF302 family)
MIRKVEMDRFTVISAKPFDEVVAAIKTSIGNPNMAEFWKSMQEAKSAPELDGAIQRVLGRKGLMLFVEFDHGMILRKGTELHTSKITRLVSGNPLIMKERAKHVPDAGSYAPVTVLVDERPDGVHPSYDRMASLLGTYGNSDALTGRAIEQGDTPAFSVLENIRPIIETARLSNKQPMLTLA